MLLRLNTGEALPSYFSSIASIFSAHPDVSRWAEDEEQLSGFERGTLPLRVRPAFLVLNVLALVVLGILGFHPRAGDAVPLNDKILHFICFFLATGLFYFIWDIDEPARRVWIWRNMPFLLTWIICFVAGGVGSEIVQSLIPYKTFQWGDVLANLLGSGFGLLVSFHAEKRHRLRREIERLYEPLDQELYGDAADEEDEQYANNGLGGHDGGGNVHDPWRSVDSSSRQRAQENSARLEGKATMHAGESTTSSSTGRGGSHGHDTLFSIEDDEEDGEGTADAWKDAR